MPRAPDLPPAEEPYDQEPRRGGTAIDPPVLVQCAWGLPRREGKGIANARGAGPGPLARVAAWPRPPALGFAAFFQAPPDPWLLDGFT